jgi:hypothetical protein
MMQELVRISLSERRPRKVGLDGASVAFGSVFGQSVKTRVSILKVLNISAGPMKFKDILDNVRSEAGGETLSPQNLTYHLSEMKDAHTIDQDSNDQYTITPTGHFLLSSYITLDQDLRREKPRRKPGFVGELSASINHPNYDCNLLAEELSRTPFFIRVPSLREGVSFTWKDSDQDFESEIDIGKDGIAYVKVIIYQKIINVKGSFSEDMELTREWYEAALAIAKAAYFYVKRTALRLWTDAEVKITFSDAYGVSLYANGGKE